MADSRSKSSNNSSINKSYDVAALPWNFEAFRRYLNFEVLQQAAGVLCLFDGENLLSDSHLMSEFTNLVQQRTKLDWVPDRQASDGVLFNVEGDIFRNKARVFTSFLLLDPRCLQKGDRITVTPFGEALGTGLIDRPQFYKEIVRRFRYPHPAYEDNWRAWSEANCTTRPLALILKVLIELFKIDSHGGVTAGELATYLHPQPFCNSIPIVVDKILESRKGKQKSDRQRSDSIDRKLNDILGFLCISRLAFYDKTQVRLNLLDIHREESSAFWYQREGQNRLTELDSFLEECMRND